MQSCKIGKVNGGKLRNKKKKKKESKIAKKSAARQSLNCAKRKSKAERKQNPKRYDYYKIEVQKEIIVLLR